MAKFEDLLAARLEEDRLFEGVGGADVPAPAIGDDEVNALFSSPLGQKFLQAAYDRFVNVTIVEPGQAPETHGIRQGQANVVFWIAEKMANARGKD